MDSGKKQEKSNPRDKAGGPFRSFGKDAGRTLVRKICVVREFAICRLSWETAWKRRGEHVFFLSRTPETPTKRAALHVREGEIESTNVVGSILFEFRNTLDPIVLLALNLVQHRAQDVFIHMAVENLGLVPFIELADGTGCRTALNILAFFPHTRIMTLEPVYEGIAALDVAFVNLHNVSFKTYSDSCRASRNCLLAFMISSVTFLDMVQGSNVSYDEEMVQYI
uniref:Uncharacterized protein n=1 Tax=Timema tahoe TaxID=61484 RepID=A0A7R9FMP9_9NEOP|nr:unnamed protein product [Timema tahoe]